MKKLLLISTIVLCAAIYALPAQSAIIHESATLGPTGQTQGFNVLVPQLMGSRFTLEQTTRITAIGGHITVESGGLYAAIVPVSGPDLLPDPGVLAWDFEDAQEMALASVLFGISPQSFDQRGAVDVVLGPGEYAILIAADSLGFGDIVQQGQQALPGSSFFVCNDLNPEPCFDYQPTLGAPRFVVEGTVIPLPPAALLLASGLLALFGSSRVTRRKGH